MKMTNLALVAATMAIAAAARADNYWYGQTDGDASKAANWFNSNQKEGHFVSSEKSIFSYGDATKAGFWTTRTVDFSSLTDSLGQLVLANGTDEAYKLSFTGGATVAGLSLGDNGQYSSYDGWLALSAGTWNVGDSVNIGAKGKTGRLDVLANAVVSQTAGDIMLGTDNSASVGYLSVADASVSAVYDLKIGHYQGTAGEADVTGASQVSVKNVRVGNGKNTTAGLSVKGTSALASRGTFTIANGDGSKGSVVIDGGSIEISSGLYIARGDSSGGANAAATLAVTNGTIKAASMQNGYSAGSESMVTVGPGGLVDITGTAQLAWGGGIKGEIDVDGGTFKARQLDMGYYANNDSVNSKAAVAVANGGVLDITGDVLFGNLQGNKSEPNTLTLSNGGTAVVSRVYWQNGKTQNTGDKLVFDGGVLKARAANAEFISKSDSLTVEVTAKGGEIYSDYAVTVKAALTGTGTLVKSGSGTMTLESAPTCGIRIDGGTVVIPDNSTLPGKVTIGSGVVYSYNSAVDYQGGIEIEEGGYLVVSATGETSLTGITGATAQNIIVRTGDAGKVGSVSVDGTTVTITVADGTVTTTTWIGGANDQWQTAANWTHGVPTADAQTEMTVEFISDATVYHDGDCWAKTMKLNGHKVIFTPVSNTRRGLKLGGFAENDTGRLVIYATKLQGLGGTSDSNLKTLEVPEGVTLEIGNGMYNILSDSWGTIWVRGKVVMQENSELRLEYCVDLLGGVEGNGTITVDRGASNRTVGGRAQYTRYLGGDWSRFDGTYHSGVNNGTYEKTRFEASASIANQAKWIIDGDIVLGFETTATTEIAFNDLVLTNGCTLTSPCKLQLADCTIGNAVNFGDGISVDVSGGKLTFVEAAEGAESSGTIANLTIASDGIVAGTNAVAITSLTVEGSVAGPGTKLTNVATANVDGAKVVIEDSSALTAGMKYDLITAKTLSGTPEVYAVDSEGNHVAASNGKPKNWWLAKARSDVLRLAEGNPNGGLAIIIR